MDNVEKREGIGSLRGSKRLKLLGDTATGSQSFCLSTMSVDKALDTLAVYLFLDVLLLFQRTQSHNVFRAGGLESGVWCLVLSGLLLENPSRPPRSKSRNYHKLVTSHIVHVQRGAVDPLRGFCQIDAHSFCF